MYLRPFWGIVSCAAAYSDKLLHRVCPSNLLTRLSQMMLNNSAELDGGALSLSNGGILTVENEGCSSSCDLSRAGDGICDPSCMSRGCNWYASFVTSTYRQ
jgi:hypothetical protein